MTKTYDLTVFGATGFTGRQTVRHLVQNRPPELKRWAIAGRNREKLEALRREFPSGNPPEIVIADANDSGSVDRMIAGTQVLIHLAGPYAPQGDRFVTGCIAHGTHYLDLTGETFWVRGLVERLHDEAAAAKVKIIPTAGYEALPFDLGTLKAVRTVEERFGSPCTSVKVICAFTGPSFMMPGDALSGGTVGTMKVLLEMDDTDSLDDPACLVDGEAAQERVRAANPYDLSARYDPDAKAYTTPSMPLPFVNPPIIHRSNALFAGQGQGYGGDFRYSEATTLKPVLPILLWQWPAAEMVSRSFRGLSALFGPANFGTSISRKFLKQAIAWFGPSSGQGPSAKALDAMGFRLEFFAEAASGERLRGTVIGEGHPGYRSTAAMIAEAAVALARDSASLTDIYGVVTPAAGLGLGVIERMRRAGMRFEF